MSNNYILMKDGTFVSVSDDELYHYGVVGMKWGVRRAAKQLANASDSDKRAKAVSSLQKHRAKASSKVSSLQKKETKLQSKVDKVIVKNDAKAANLYAEAARQRTKAYGPLVTRKRSEERVFKANKIQAKADVLKTKSDKAKAALAKNKKMQETFSKGINDIDRILTDKGKKYLGAS